MLLDFLSVAKAHAADLAVGAVATAAAATSPFWLQLVDDVTRPGVEILGLVIVVVKLAAAIKQYRAMPSKERKTGDDT